jgi:predicted unusual protein kinase regulating ubiquinone biosynthesis (AarF/ABC1/UbiB family)
MRQLLTGNSADQPYLPPPEILRKILTELGPVYVKLGQLLSTRPDLLPPAYIEALTALQATVAPVDWQEIEAVMRQQLPQPLETVFSRVNPEPVAAGSIGQIHYALLADGQPVAVKVQRPGIEAIVEQDILLLKGLAELVAKTDVGQSYNVLGLADELATALRSELRFTQEAAYTETLRKNLTASQWFDSSRLAIPQVYQALTSDRMVVLEWLDGKPLLTADVSAISTPNKPALTRPEIANLLLRAFFQQICIDGFFHADPHPGNLFYLTDGRVALLDCGMVGRLDPRTQEVLLELLLALVSLDARRCSELTVRLAPPTDPTNLLRLEQDFDRLLRRYYSLSLSEFSFSQLFYEVLQVARENHIRIPSNLGLCAKALANLEGVGRGLDPDFNLPAQIRPLMADVFQRQIIGDSPLPAILRTVLDLKDLSLRSPRQVEMLLERLTSETLRWNLSLQELEPLRRSLDLAANRLSFSIVVGALIVGAAIISAQGRLSQVAWLSDALFAAASLLGLWLLVSILRRS